MGLTLNFASISGYIVEVYWQGLWSSELTVSGF